MTALDRIFLELKRADCTTDALALRTAIAPEAVMSLLVREATAKGARVSRRSLAGTPVTIWRLLENRENAIHFSND